MVTKGRDFIKNGAKMLLVFLITAMLVEGKINGKNEVQSRPENRLGSTVGKIPTKSDGGLVDNKEKIKVGSKLDSKDSNNIDNTVKEVVYPVQSENSSVDINTDIKIDKSVGLEHRHKKSDKRLVEDGESVNPHVLKTVKNFSKTKTHHRKSVSDNIEDSEHKTKHHTLHADKDDSKKLKKHFAISSSLDNQYSQSDLNNQNHEQNQYDSGNQQNQHGQPDFNLRFGESSQFDPNLQFSQNSQLSPNFQYSQLNPNFQSGQNGQLNPNFQVGQNGLFDPNIQLSQNGQLNPNFQSSLNGQFYPNFQSTQHGQLNPNFQSGQYGLFDPNIQLSQNGPLNPNFQSGQNGQFYPNFQLSQNGPLNPNFQSGQNGQFYPNFQLSQNGPLNPNFQSNLNGQFYPNLQLRQNGPLNPNFQSSLNGQFYPNFQSTQHGQFNQNHEIGRHRHNHKTSKSRFAHRGKHLSNLKNRIKQFIERRRQKKHRSCQLLNALKDKIEHLESVYSQNNYYWNSVWQSSYYNQIFTNVNINMQQLYTLNEKNDDESVNSDSAYTHKIDEINRDLDILLHANNGNNYNQGFSETYQNSGTLDDFLRERSSFTEQNTKENDGHSDHSNLVRYADVHSSETRGDISESNEGNKNVQVELTGGKVDRHKRQIHLDKSSDASHSSWSSENGSNKHIQNSPYGPGHYTLSSFEKSTENDQEKHLQDESSKHQSCKIHH